MTETNINALCSVEAVFDGVDIEVTVEFSSGGGTFEHDELTEESRSKAGQHPTDAIYYGDISLTEVLEVINQGLLDAKEHNNLSSESRELANQHPIVAITNLNENLQALRDAIRAAAGATLSISINPNPQTINTDETQLTWSETLESTDTEIIDFNNSLIDVKKAGRYFFASNIKVNKTVQQARTLYLTVRDADTNELIAPYPRTIDLAMGTGIFTIATQTIQVDIDEPKNLKLSAYASASGLSFVLLETNFYTSTGGGSGLWKENSEAELIFPAPINMQEQELRNSSDTNINGLKSVVNGGDITDAIYSWFKGLFPSLVDGSVKSYIIGLLSVVKDLATRVGLLEDKYILKYVVPVDTNVINLTTDRYGNAFNFTEGDKIEISFSIPNWVIVSSNLNRINFRFNNNLNFVYNISQLAANQLFISAGTNYKSQRVHISLIYNNGELIGLTTSQSVTSTDTKVSEIYTLHTIGFNAMRIYEINLLTSLTTSKIPAGTIFIIKKL